MNMISNNIDTTIIDAHIKKGDKESLDLAFMLLLGQTNSILDCCFYFFEKTYKTQRLRAFDNINRSRLSTFSLPFLGKLCIYGDFNENRKTVHIESCRSSKNNLQLIFFSPWVMTKGRVRKYITAPKKAIRFLIDNDIIYYIQNNLKCFNPTLWEELKEYKEIDLDDLPF